MITIKAPRCDVKHLNTEIIFFLSKALHNPLGRELALSYSPLSLSVPTRAHGFQLLVKQGIGCQLLSSLSLSLCVPPCAHGFHLLVVILLL
jgi:hypothetical protein